MKRSFGCVLALVGGLVSGCATTDGPTLNDAGARLLDFHEIQWFAARAKAAYGTPDEIRRDYPHTVRVGELKDIDVQYFVEQLPDRNVQVVTVRGTANLENALEDAEYWQSENARLKVYVHKGFSDDAGKVYADVVPYLSKDNPVIVTGHSLGAAIATIIMMYLHEDGFTVAPTYNFGQPKVTNKAGVAAYDFLPVTRVVDRDDVVPLVPPVTLVDSLHGVYEHLGDEVILLDGIYYSYLPKHDAERKSVGSFWVNLFHESIKDHYMDNYLANISGKEQQATAVDYSVRRIQTAGERPTGVDVSVGEIGVRAK